MKPNIVDELEIILAKYNWISSKTGIVYLGYYINPTQSSEKYRDHRAFTPAELFEKIRDYEFRWLENSIAEPAKIQIIYRGQPDRLDGGTCRIYHRRTVYPL